MTRISYSQILFGPKSRNFVVPPEVLPVNNLDRPRPSARLENETRLTRQLCASTFDNCDVTRPIFVVGGKTTSTTPNWSLSVEALGPYGDTDHGGLTDKLLHARGRQCIALTCCSACACVVDGTIDPSVFISILELNTPKKTNKSCYSFYAPPLLAAPQPRGSHRRVLGTGERAQGPDDRGRRQKRRDRDLRQSRLTFCHAQISHHVDYTSEHCTAITRRLYKVFANVTSVFAGWGTLRNAHKELCSNNFHLPSRVVNAGGAARKS
ncbi:hypothetical protein EVAR_77821_1 [Eumeta japonica]|uniref:Uncharacterized protein n=1 Tax=Eumeta variegata TaxID=151549 RepID=A0A4C1TE83_EUMVA|nr:hypothetical protein EVAR_77821_1 [Eumeta japonica]